MKKIMNYLSWIPFSICAGALLIYLFYTIRIKLDSSIVVTQSLTNTLKTYLIIALISLLVGLFIVLIKKIYNLLSISDGKIKKLKVKKEKIKKEKIKKEKVKKVKEEKIVRQEPVVQVIEKEIVEPKLKEEYIKSQIIKPRVIEEKIVEVKREYKFDGVLCYECGGLISKNAGICPHCGILFDDKILKVIERINKKHEKKEIKKQYKKKKSVIIADILLIILFLFLIFLISNKIINQSEINKDKISYVEQS